MSCSEIMNTKTSLTFHTFPPEIREKIFAPCVRWSQNNRYTTALIPALRGDSKLYGEALSLLCRDNTFILHSSNGWRFGSYIWSMSLNVLSTIQRLRVKLIDIHFAIGSGRLIFLKSDLNIRILEIDSATNSGTYLNIFGTALEALLARCKVLTRLDLHLPSDCRRCTWVGSHITSMAGDFECRIVERWNIGLGVPAKMTVVDVPVFTHYEDRTNLHSIINGVFMLRRERRTWFWQAEEGEYLRIERRKLENFFPRVPGTISNPDLRFDCSNADSGIYYSDCGEQS